MSKRKTNANRRTPAKKRTRPLLKSRARRAKNKQRPLPKAPTRRSKVAAKSAAQAKRPATQAADSSSDYQIELRQIQSQFDRLDDAAQLPDIYSSIGEIDQQLVQLPLDLETLRTRGYVHGGELEDALEALDDQWDEVRPRIEDALGDHVKELDREMNRAERRVTSLTSRVSAANVKAAETAVDTLDNRIDAARSALSGLYSGIDTELDQLAYKLRQIDTMLDTIDGSPGIVMREAEAPLLLVKAEWQQDGDEGPDGYLVLTDQRLLFEQREEVVTKKRFGLFKAESEMVQELLLDIPIHEIESVDHKREGGFLGMGKDDIMNITCTARAPISRAQFHLDGQRSEEWAKMVKLVQTGDIDEQRADEYVDEIDAAEETAASFPEHCPTCFAGIPPQPRGITSVTCTFCGMVIEPSIGTGD